MASEKELTLPPQVNPSPKTLFRSSAVKVKNHHNMIGSPVLKESIDTALLEYQVKLARDTKESNGAAAAMFKIKGALEFVDELIRLADAPYTPKQQTEPSRIDHSV